MAKTKKSPKKNKLDQAKYLVKKINNDLIDASFNAIETSVKTGEKWQKLTSKLIKKSEPLTKKQIGMFVQTADNLKQQADFSLTRLKKLVGYNDNIVDDAKKMVATNSMVKKAEKMVSKLKKEVSENPFVQKAEKISDKLQREAYNSYEELKDKVEDYVKPAKKATKKKVVAKKIAVKKVATKKVVEKVMAKKKVAKKVMTTKNDDLKVIKGIGPKMEAILNDNGISTFEQLAESTAEGINKFLVKEGVNIKRYDANAWIAIAKTI